MEEPKFNFGGNDQNNSESDDSTKGGFFKIAKEKKEISPPSNTNAKSGGGLFKIDFEELNKDFKMPPSYKIIKKMGTGAYGKVMQVLHMATKKTYAVKRFEEVFSRELRGKRLLRELNILKSVKHPCLNKLKCVIPPEDINNFNQVYLVLDLCDMDLKKLLKSSKHLQEL